ncbi:MAG: OsmC family protein [Cyanobacteriota bacterium]
MNLPTTPAKIVNGIDTKAVEQSVDTISQDFTQGIVKFQVNTAWSGGTKSATRVESWELGGQKLAKNFTIYTDEPEELAGTNTAPNPQETLMAALNACMMVGYVINAAMLGIELEKLEISSEGVLDLRGAFGLDETVKPGNEEICYTVRIKGNGTPEQFQEIHKAVMATSPNFWNITNPVKLKPELCVE